MKRPFEVWVRVEGIEKPEGVRTTHIGTVLATTFREACDDLLGKSDSYHSDNATYWGYRLHNSEKDARSE